MTFARTGGRGGDETTGLAARLLVDSLLDAPRRRPTVDPRRRFGRQIPRR